MTSTRFGSGREGLAVEGDWRVVNAASEPLKGHAVIVAAGSALKPLGVPGEEAFIGRGVSHCGRAGGGPQLG